MALAAEVLEDAPFRLTLVADPEAVRKGLAQIMASRPMAALAADHRAAVQIVLAEVLNNIAEHAYSGGPGEISISIVPSPDGPDCRIVDRGRAMPGGSPPQGTLPEEELPEGGFGWFLIRSLTRDLDYQRRDGQNHLHFVIPA